MAAVTDDPASPTNQRISGQLPFPDPNSPGLPADIFPRRVTLRDRQTAATIVPFTSRDQLPISLLAYLCDQLNREIEGGDTYPMTEAFTTDGFADYWFQMFGAVMLLGNIDSADDVTGDKDWAKQCLGSFFIKPNYPGRSSHICNASFITTDESRNRGVGRLMGEAYIDWAPRLGYTYSVFNLVYETNLASCRIWDALGFKRIGRIKACGNLRSHPDRLIDAIIYGRDLVPGESEELVSEERFDKIRFYLKYGKYPNGADRAEKSRLRSAATHYKLLEGDKLMLKDKEVISDPQRQCEIARNTHANHHGGINKTTAIIAEKYHWSRIKETVSDVIRACEECKDLGKTPNPGGMRKTVTPTRQPSPPLQPQQPQQPVDHQRMLALQHNHTGLIDALAPPDPVASHYANPSDITVLATSQSTSPSSSQQQQQQQQQPHQHHQGQQQQSTHILNERDLLHGQATAHQVYQPIDPQIMSHHDTTQQDDMSFDQYHPHADFQALLNATGDVVSDQDEAAAAAAAAVDRDLEMLIEQDMDEDVEHEMQGLEETVQREPKDDELYNVHLDQGDG